MTKAKEPKPSPPAPKKAPNSPFRGAVMETPIAEPCPVCGWPVAPGATCTVDGWVSK